MATEAKHVLEGELVTDMPRDLARYEAPKNDLALTAVFDLATAKKRMKELQEFVQSYLVKGEDYGIIPGTPKPTLYKSGADKLCDIYGIADRYKTTNRTEDWSTNLFDYEIECTLVSKRDERLIATGLGSCNSYEGKYRYRESKRKCPNCSKETIIKGKAEYGGGWLCWNKPGKSDGCGAKFPDGDRSIESQEVGKVENDDIATIKNTLLKMAKKRAKVDAVLSATRSSGLFTQDVEDWGTIEQHEEGSKQQQQTVAAEKPANQKPQSVGDRKIQEYKKKTTEKVEPEQGFQVELIEWKAGSYALTGNGLAIVRAELNEEEKKQFNFRFEADAKGFTIPAAQAHKFASVCEKHNVKAIFKGAA